MTLVPPLPRRRFCQALACATALPLASRPAMATPPTPGTPRLPAALARPALPVRRPTQSVLLALARAGNRLVAAGERGLVIWSDDGGRRWTQAEVPVSVTLTAVAFSDPREGWAVGNMGVVLRSRDGGQRWQPVLDGHAAAALALKAAQTAPANPTVAGAAGSAAAGALEEAQRLVDEGPDKPWLDIALRPDGSVWVLGAYGLAFATRDGGQHWQPCMHRLPNPEGLSYYGWVARGEEEFIYGEQGLLLRSAGPQQPFVPQDTPAQGSLFAALSLREGPLLLMGLRGRLLRSAAPGAPWQTLQTPVEASLFGGLQLADGTVLLLGAAGQLLASSDQGRRFQPLALPVRFPFNAAAPTADGALVLVGQRGLLRLAADDLKIPSA